MGLLNQLFGRDRGQHQLDALLRTKNQDLTELTTKLRRVALFSAQRAELMAQRERLLDQLHDLERQRHGETYAAWHKVRRQNQSL
jgi:hypothetical protein